MPENRQKANFSRENQTQSKVEQGEIEKIWKFTLPLVCKIITGGKPKETYDSTREEHLELFLWIIGRPSFLAIVILTLSNFTIEQIAKMIN
jgi:hypothetical protein